MRSDTDRLLATVEQVLKAGELGQRERVQQRTRIEMTALVSECVAVTLTRHHLPPEAICLEDVPGNVRLFVMANPEDLRTAVLNLLDNAVKYSPQGVQVRCRLSIEHYTWAVLTIIDTGLGIQARDPFTASSSRFLPCRVQ